MQAIVKPSVISGTIVAPASKSAMQRACAASLIRKGVTVLHNPGRSADDQAALDIIRQLGARINDNGSAITIESNGIDPVNSVINCGESGLSVRMFTPIAALSPLSITVMGSGSLLKRPLGFFNEVLPELKVNCSSNEGMLPLHIQGPLVPKNIQIDGSLSSQFLTGILFSYSAAGANNVTVEVQNLNSKPYIDLTLKVLRDFGLNTPENNNYSSFHFNGQPNVTSNESILNYTVEGDWSGGAFLLVAGAIAGDSTVKGLDINSKQADQAILQALKKAGVDLQIESEFIHVRKGELNAFQFNATDCPDLFPPLVALAACCKGATTIEGVHRLTHKESNRALTLQEEYHKMGIKISFEKDNMIINGGEITGTMVQSHHDHRIAMACAVSALRATETMVINEAQAVNKSYPDFWRHLQQLAGTVSLKQN